MRWSNVVDKSDSGVLISLFITSSGLVSMGVGGGFSGLVVCKFSPLLGCDNILEVVFRVC